MNDPRVGSRYDSAPLQVPVVKVKVPLLAVIATWSGHRLLALCLWLVRHPSAVLAIALPVAAWRATMTLGLAPVVIAATVLVGMLLAWRQFWPDAFTRHLVWTLRGAWRSLWVYRSVWHPAMVTTGLSITLNDAEYLPKITRVRSTGSVDEVTVKMMPGQTLEDWTRNAPRLAQTFGVLEARVRSVPGHPHYLTLWFLIYDPLLAPVAPFPVAEADPDLTALPVALREDGLTYKLKLLGTHLLIVGATGSGKGSVLWSALNALAPAIREGVAQVWAVDPKGGMELAPGAGLFTRFAYGDADSAEWENDFARLLEEAVAVMRRRQTALRGKTRLHTPTVVEPLILVVVDELASLTAYCNDREAKKRIAAALSLLLSQGRAVGVTVIGALQDPRKEVLPFRDLFPTRIALRLSEPEQVAFVLGHGARDRGARCDTIPEALPGVGYIALDGIAEPIRVRFSHITDADIDDLARWYAPRTTAACIEDAGAVA